MKTFIPSLLATTGLAVLAFNSAHAQIKTVAPPTAAASQETFSGDICGNKVNLVLKTPGADANPDLKKIFGVWGGGKWDNNMCTGLAVLEINGDVATIQYFAGVNSYVRKDAVMKDGQLVFATKFQGYNASYQLMGDGRLDGRHGPAKLVDRLQKLQ